MHQNYLVELVELLNLQIHYHRDILHLLNHRYGDGDNEVAAMGRGTDRVRLKITTWLNNQPRYEHVFLHISNIIYNGNNTEMKMILTHQRKGKHPTSPVFAWVVLLENRRWLDLPSRRTLVIYAAHYCLCRCYLQRLWQWLLVLVKGFASWLILVWSGRYRICYCDWLRVRVGFCHGAREGNMLVERQHEHIKTSLGAGIPNHSCANECPWKTVFGAN